MSAGAISVFPVGFVHVVSPLLIALDALTVISAALASYLWFRASRRKLRRISKHEVLDHADFNRLITALNRAQILNSRAALATGVTTALASISLLGDMI